MLRARSTVLAAVLTAVLSAVLALTGCSADDTSRSQLSQTAKTASASARAASLSIGLHEKDKLTEAVLDTALEDVGQKLGSSANELTSLAAVGGIARQRDRILGQVRSAQDTLLDAQSQLSVGKGGGDTLDPQRRRLAALSVTLQKESQALEAHG